MNVKAVFTTDDPADDLGYHRAIARDADFGVRVSPTFRPDKAVNIDAHGFLPWLKRLEAVSGGGIKTLSGFTAALEERIRFFKLNGCVCADHDLGGVPDGAGEEETAAKTFLNVLNGGSVTRAEAENYRVYMLRFFGGEYLKNGFVQQYHIGALRNVSSRAFSALGADAGFDAVGDARFAAPLSRLLDGLDRAGRLPKTILYCLNPSDNAVLCALKNCFQDGATAGKIQFGAAWWFNDHAGGICRQLDDCMQSGSLGKFVGMLTDSRSFLSYPRHEYFRRILCDKIGAIIESGEYPPDLQAAGKIISDVCFYNAVDYFGVAETGKLSVPE
jgi:glucuronate isomerase